MTPTANRRMWLCIGALTSSMGIPIAIEYIHGAWSGWFGIISLIATVAFVISMIPEQVRGQIR